MNLTGHLSIRSKLVALLLLASFISTGVIGYLGYRSGKDALTEAIYNQLTTLRALKTQQVQAAFSNSHDQILAFAENRSIVDAVSEFRTAYRLAARESLSETEKIALSTYYRNDFIPRLKMRQGGEPEVKHYLPETSAATYLQYHYLAANPHDTGKKDELILAAGDGGYYAQVHERYHESLRSLLKKFGYYDLFLLDHETGDILYSVFKETDFATSLTRGPYASSSFASLIKEVMRTRERGKVSFQDFDVYAPSYSAPAAFAAVTVYDGKDIVGILALQLSAHKLNQLMTSNQQWESSGMGKTGEVYLVGRNRLMRSDSRFLLQDRERYLERLRNIGMSGAEIARIDKLNTTILSQPVHGETVDLALSGKSGIREITDYRGVPVMSAYAPLRTQGLDWVILSEMDIAEINIPIDKFRRQVLVTASILGVVLTLLALLAASYITRPIQALVAGLRRVGAGETDVQLKVRSHDELGELTHSFNTMVEGIKQQQTLITDKDRENDLLLQNILPEPIAQRMKSGEEHIVDRVPNVSVIFTTLTGLTNNGNDEDPEDAIAKINQLVDAFDQAAEKLGVEKIKTIGDDYLATCGLITPRLDHSKRALEFARESMAIVQRINDEYGLRMELRVGIHSGAVLAGVIGRTRFVYDIWGETVDIVNELRFAAAPRSISISATIHESLHDKGDFVQGAPIQIKDGNTVETWFLIDNGNPRS